MRRRRPQTAAHLLNGLGILKQSDAFDAVIVGGGPAGLAAAFWLARYRRRVRIYDTGDPRNEPSWAVHGYPGLPDVPPLELRRVLREQALGAGAELVLGEVIAIDGTEDDFTVRVRDAEPARARRIVLAYGLQNVLPDIPGIESLYGRSVFHCPDCDGPSMIEARIGLLGNGRKAGSVALFLLSWSSQVTVLTNGETPDFTAEQMEQLARNGIEVRTGKIERLEETAGRLTAVHLSGSDPLPLDGLFFDYPTRPACTLAQSVGCSCLGTTTIVLDSSQETSVPGIYAAGDLGGPPYLTISAAAGGARVALSIHRSLIDPDRFMPEQT